MKILPDASARFALDEFLARPLFAHLATSSSHGPRDSPCWFLWEGGALWIIGEPRVNSYLTRIREDPRVAVGIVDFRVATGSVQHVGIRGTASVQPWDIARARRLLSRYLGDDPAAWDPLRFLPNLEMGRDRVFVKVVPETVVLRDQSYNVGKGPPRPSR